MEPKDDKTKTEPGKESSTDSEKVAKLEAEIDALKQKNSWLTEESKKNATKYKNLRDSVGEAEKAALEKAGKFEERLEIEKKDKASALKENEELKDSLIELKVLNELSIHAGDAHNRRDILMQKTFREHLKVEDGQVKGVKEGVEAVKKENPVFIKITFLV